MYTVYSIRCASSVGEIIIALLADAGFDSFEETDEGVTAYAPSVNAAAHIEKLEELSDRFQFTYGHEEMETRNWNEVWESSFSPIRVGDRLAIRATFHPAFIDVEHDLVIDPKMSFGTGHHATTHMMCELLLEYISDASEAPRRVLDYGCGTGVLGILSLRLGAQTVDAVDIEEWAVENSEENAQANGVRFNRLKVGTLTEILTGKPYDLVLANINRNVLLDSGEALWKNIRNGGRAFLSGILQHDEKMVVDHYRRLGFTHLRTVAREDWRALELLRE